MREYENLSLIFRFVAVDGERPIYEQHKRIRQLFQEGRRAAWGEWNVEALAEWMEWTGIHEAIMASRTEARPQLIALDGTRHADLRKAARDLRERLASHKIKSGVSWWDASGVFFEVGLGKKKHRAASPRTLCCSTRPTWAFRLRWEIRPALASGQTVIAAPYLDTALAFGEACRLPRDWMASLFASRPHPTRATSPESADGRPDGKRTARGLRGIRQHRRRRGGAVLRSIRRAPPDDRTSGDDRAPAERAGRITDRPAGPGQATGTAIRSKTSHIARPWPDRARRWPPPV